VTHKWWDRLASTWLLANGQVTRLPEHGNDEVAVAVAEAVGKIAAAAEGTEGVYQCQELKTLRDAGWKLSLELSELGLVLYASPPKD
jgi:hypothetical protein